MGSVFSSPETKKTTNGLSTGDANPDVDVVIIGGGPTGLFTGLLLDRLGVSVRILDAKPAHLDLGRADALNARTQQYLEVANLLDDLLAQGIKCNTSSTFSEGEFKSRQNHWWTGLQYCLHKNFLMIGQPMVEKLLSSKIPKLVTYNTKITSIAPSSSSSSSSTPFVKVTTENGEGITAKYALGADGAKSTVRSSLGISFAGTKPEMLWAVLDTFIETDFPKCDEIITFQVNGQSRVSWIPRERGLARFYVLLEGEVSLERAQESIKKHMEPHAVEFKSMEWYSTFDVKERIADTFIYPTSGRIVDETATGNVILAGDAAHVHSVNGGQGLNTGLADAFSIAWRLATVVNQPSLTPKAIGHILGSYDTERRKTAQGVIDVAAVLVRDTVHTAKQYVATIEKNAGYITGMGVSYDSIDSPLVKESEIGIWKAGKRCPDVEVTHGTQSTRLYSVASYGSFLLLQIGQDSEASSIQLGPDLDRIVTRYGISTEEAAAAKGSGSKGTVSLVAEWANDDGQLYVVVRPDMYIGVVSRELSEVTGYLNGVFDL